MSFDPQRHAGPFLLPGMSLQHTFPTRDSESNPFLACTQTDFTTPNPQPSIGPSTFLGHSSTSFETPPTNSLPERHSSSSSTAHFGLDNTHSRWVSQSLSRMLAALLTHIQGKPREYPYNCDPPDAHTRPEPGMQNVRLAAELQTTNFLLLLVRTFAGGSGVASAPLTLSTTTTPLPPLDCKQYKKAGFWQEKDYRNARVDRENTRAGLTVVEPKALRVRARMAAGENVQHWFITNVDGEPISAEQVEQQNLFARDLWNVLDSRGLACPTWSAVDAKSKQFFYHEMESKFFELRLCDNNYKSKTICTLSYGSWYKHRPSLRVSAKADPDDLEAVSMLALSGKRKRDEADEGDEDIEKDVQAISRPRPRRKQQPVASSSHTPGSPAPSPSHATSPAPAPSPAPASAPAPAPSPIRAPSPVPAPSPIRAPSPVPAPSPIRIPSPICAPSTVPVPVSNDPASAAMPTRPPLAPINTNTTQNPLQFDDPFDNGEPIVPSGRITFIESIEAKQAASTSKTTTSKAAGKKAATTSSPKQKLKGVRKSKEKNLPRDFAIDDWRNSHGGKINGDEFGPWWDTLETTNPTRYSVGQTLTGYRWTVHKNDPLVHGHSTQYWCSQDSGRKQVARPSERPDAKHRETPGMDRFPCKGFLTISCYGSGNEFDNMLTVSINLRHRVRHLTYR
uniref:Uncharacterized protein n=1 Tax=Mycena chlorophos TaxID=658473 RepID=A0ABQ0LPW0_MYCCL|nr:predicted protein [Mycena chlorophos]